MIPVTGFEGATVAVMGLGRSGLAAAKALAAGGARVLAWDDSAETRAAAERAGVPVHGLDGIDWAGIADLVWSPGIPHSFPAPHPVSVAARLAHIQLVADIDILYRSLPDPRYLGVTGTNGKSTTTALIHHVLTKAGQSNDVGGNLGPPALGLRPLGPDGTYVLEMSSFQLELVPHVVFDVAVLVNITPDHLDRHGGMDGYIAAKRRLFDEGPRARGDGWAVVGIDDEASRAICTELRQATRRRVVPVSAETPVGDGVSCVGGLLVDALSGAPRTVMDVRTVATLPGQHNWQNAAAAYAALRACDVAPDAIADAIASYPGLPHRQELVATVDGVAWINDSKATNADSAAKALGCYRDIHWIAGGLAKAGGIAPLAPWFDRIAHAYLLGEAAPAFGMTLEGRVSYSACGDLATAVEAAGRAARPGSVVLLSPACASYDQWRSFEARGDAFRALAQARAAGGAR